MKSPTTIIQHLERAIRIQEMIRKSDWYRSASLSDVKRYRDDRQAVWYRDRRAIRMCVRKAWKYRRIHNYLKKRFALTISKI